MKYEPKNEDCKQLTTNTYDNESNNNMFFLYENGGYKPKEPYVLDEVSVTFWLA